MPGFLAALPAIAAGGSLLGKILGGGAKGAADNRTNNNAAIASQNAREASIYGTQQNAATNLAGLDERATMDRANLGITAPQARTKQALLAALIGQHRPVSVNAPSGIRMGQITGGAQDGFGADAKAASSELYKQAMAALQSGSDIPEAANYSASARLAPPTAMPMEEPGKMESILSGGGLLASLIGGGATIADLIKGKQPIVDDYGEFGG